MQTKIEVGDYVEVVKPISGIVEAGEQGIVIVDRSLKHDSWFYPGKSAELELMFPAREDIWSNDEQKFSGAYGLVASPDDIKLVYRPVLARKCAGKLKYT